MRDLRFRAWAKPNQKMYYDVMVGGFPNGKVTGTVPVVWNKERGDWANLWASNLSDGYIMQYTGLKDRSGLEIYDGDILCDVIESEKAKPEFVYLVDWAEDIGPSWVAIPPRGRVFLAEMKLSLYTIIGNIYENPELLDVHTSKDVLERLKGL